MVKVASRIQLQKGDAAPEFTLPATNGRTYSLADFRGKDGLMVLFMCNHCPYVKARIGCVADLHQEFGERIAFVGINSSDPDYPGEGMENMKIFVADQGINFPYLLDEWGRVAKAYGATCTPDPFLFDGEQKLVFHGRITDALEPEETPQEFTMRNNIQKLIDQKPIDPWFNPSLGCSIKFKE